jgi:competence protein ComEC
MPDRVRILPKIDRRWLFPAAISGWLVVGLLAGLARSTPDEMRVTFVAVDHGGCAVIETPDGRVLLYDVGATAGPDVTRRQVAPFLWSRGIRRIDEVFLSHADLDHFNGLVPLLDRFAVGQVTLTPTFSEKPTGGVRATLDALERRRIAVRIVRAGDRLSAGEVKLEVLHPPADGPAGVENVRSLVLLVRHRGHTILLTGDLEGPGVDAAIARKVPAVDVLMTPHHGSGANRAGDLADWARPRLVVACQGRKDGGKSEPVYRKKAIPYWSTWPDGAITIRSHATGLVAETFATGRREVVRAGGDP